MIALSYPKEHFGSEGFSNLNRDTFTTILTISAGLPSIESWFGNCHRGGLRSAGFANEYDTVPSLHLIESIELGKTVR